MSPCTKNMVLNIHPLLRCKPFSEMMAPSRGQKSWYLLNPTRMRIQVHVPSLKVILYSIPEIWPQFLSFCARTPIMRIYGSPILRIYRQTVSFCSLPAWPPTMGFCRFAARPPIVQSMHRLTMGLCSFTAGPPNIAAKRGSSSYGSILNSPQICLCPQNWSMSPLTKFSFKM